MWKETAIMLSWHLPRGTKENHKKSRSGQWVSWMRFKPYKYKSEVTIIHLLDIIHLSPETETSSVD
jgi:hypothetical protein